MPDFTDLGRVLMLAGVVLVVVGGVLTLLDKWPTLGSAFGWLGKLPGDIVIKRDHFSLYFPLATSIVISVVVSVLLYILSRR
jgi:hypothetical protein